MNHSAGQILTKKHDPRTKRCGCCESRAWLIRFISGFLKVWIVRCARCGNQSPEYLSQDEAMLQWNDSYRNSNGDVI